LLFAWMGKRMRIAILDDIHEAYEGTRGVRRLRDRAEVKIFTTSFGDPSALRGFDAVVANRERTKFTRALFERLPDLRIIAQTGNHAYHIDLAAAEDRKIIVGKATGGGCTSAAELAIGLMLALLRQIPSIDREVKQGRWPTPGPPGQDIGHCRLGLCGSTRHQNRPGIRDESACLGSEFDPRCCRFGWGRKM
jgi:phosphoglycerate dehydrogenase-like enzyme